MAFSIVILIFSCLLLLGFTLRSRYGLPLLLMTAGISVVSAAVLFQTFNVSTYSPPAFFPLRRLDLALYRFIGSFRLPQPQAQRLRSLGTLLFFLGIFLLLLVIIRNLLDARLRLRLRITAALFSVLFTTAFLLFYSPACAYRLYLHACTLSGEARTLFRQRLELMDLFFRVGTGLFILSPVILLLIRYLKQQLTYFGDTFLLLLVITFLYDTAFYTLFFTGPFAQSVDAVIRSGFWFFSSAVRIPLWITLAFPLFAFFLLMAVLLSARGIFSGELVLLSRKRALRRSIEELNRNLKDVFHSEKNLMFSILLLARETREDWGTPEGLEKLDRLQEIAEKRMESITSSLNRIRALHLHPTPVDMRSLMDAALADMPFPEDMQIEKVYCSFPARCMIDEYHTRSALKNLFANSVEALQTSSHDKRILRVTVDASREWVFLSVRDNGTGIDRHELRRVLLPFVSTKSKNENWGIGLSYVFRVVNAQLGQMRIVSRSNTASFTEIDILLPRERRNDT